MSNRRGPAVRRLVAVLALVALAAACSSDEEPERGLEAIDTPEFAPAQGGSASTAPVGVEGGPGTSSPTTAAPGQTSAETTTTAAALGGGGSPQRLQVSFDDPLGDGVGGVDDSPPAWADLAGATLERQGSAYRLTVRLGADVPETQPGAGTMNVASFFDIDGDGGIDHELWVNLGDAGWGPVWYEGDTAYPGEASNVTVVVEGRELRLLFPDVMLDAPPALRFSLASEYGELSVIGSDFAHRDDAPDGDQAVAFP